MDDLRTLHRHIACCLKGFTQATLEGPMNRTEQHSTSDTTWSPADGAQDAANREEGRPQAPREGDGADQPGQEGGVAEAPADRGEGKFVPRTPDQAEGERR